MADSRSMAVDRIEERRTYVYRVRTQNKQTIKGQQKAYSPTELTVALQKQGLEVLSVQRKWPDYQMKPSGSQVMLFVRLAANMVRRKIPFDETLDLLITDVSSPSLKQVLRDLNSDLKGGMDSLQAFQKHQHMLGKFTAYMLGIASKSGNMAPLFEATAKYLERKESFRKNIRSALLTPTIAIILVMIAFVWYVWQIIPATIELFSDFEVELPFFTRHSLSFAAWMDSNWVWVFVVTILLFAGFVSFSRTQKGRMWIHQHMLKIPVVGPLFHKMFLEIYCRVFAVLYSGAGANDQTIKIAAESTGNVYMEHRIKAYALPMMMAKGHSLIAAMEAAAVFTPIVIARFRAGLSSGAVRDAAQEVADFYEMDTDQQLEIVLEMIKTSLAILVAALVAFLTIVSAESAFIIPTTGGDIFNSIG
jgi:type IV pilus assembly protein PilC